MKKERRISVNVKYIFPVVKISKSCGFCLLKSVKIEKLHHSSHGKKNND